MKAGRREDIRYFDELGDAMRKRLPASANFDGLADRILRANRVERRKGFEWQTLDEPTKRGLARAAKTAPQIVDSKWAAAGENDQRLEIYVCWRASRIRSRACGPPWQKMSSARSFPTRCSIPTPAWTTRASS